MNREMPIGQALRAARLSRGLRQRDVAGIGFVSHQMISGVELGVKRLARDCLRRVAEHLDDPRLHLAAAAEVTGGAFASVWLDGQRVDLHRAAVRLKVEEELAEVLAAIRGVDDANPGADQGQVKVVLLQALDAREGLDMYVATRCLEHQISPRALFREHRQKLKARGYVAA